MEAITATLSTFGVVFMLISWVVLLINSYKDDFAWGLCSTLLPPLAYLYGLFRLDVAKEALFLAVIGCALLAAGVN